MSEPIKHDGLKYLCEMYPEDRMLVFDDVIWIANPGRPMRRILPDGKVEECHGFKWVPFVPG